MNKKLKTLKGDVYTTVQQIAHHLQTEHFKAEELCMRVDRIEQSWSPKTGKPSNSANTDDFQEYTESQLDVFRKVLVRMD
jgi:hypothetical protein